VNIRARIIPTLALVKIRSYEKLDQYFLFPTLAPVNKLKKIDFLFLTKLKLDQYIIILDKIILCI
jgi:hypothetical protein